MREIILRSDQITILREFILMALLKIILVLIGRFDSRIFSTWDGVLAYFGGSLLFVLCVLLNTFFVVAGLLEFRRKLFLNAGSNSNAIVRA